MVLWKKMTFAVNAVKSWYQLGVGGNVLIRLAPNFQTTTISPAQMQTGQIELLMNGKASEP